MKKMFQLTCVVFVLISCNRNIVGVEFKNKKKPTYYNFHNDSIVEITTAFGLVYTNYHVRYFVKRNKIIFEYGNPHEINLIIDTLANKISIKDTNHYEVLIFFNNNLHNINIFM